MNLENLVGLSASQKLEKSGINVLHACENEISYIAGKVAAKKITAAKQLIFSTDEKKQIKSSNDSYLLVRELQFLGNEEFYILALNRNNRVINKILISVGGTCSTVVDQKIIFKKLLLCGASGFICAHNHPSGNLEPSQDDISMTKRLKEISLLLDIKLIDHIIVAGNSYTSFCDIGYL